MDRRHPLVKIVYRLTEPSWHRSAGRFHSFGGLDFSPLVLLIALRVLRRLGKSRWPGSSQTSAATCH